MKYTTLSGISGPVNSKIQYGMLSVHNSQQNLSLRIDWKFGNNLVNVFCMYVLNYMALTIIEAQNGPLFFLKFKTIEKLTKILLFCILVIYNRLVVQQAC